MDDQRASSRRLVLLGVVVAIVGGLAAPVLVVAALLTANPCGAFGDACDEYGSTSTASGVLLTLAFLAVGALVAGAVLCVVGVRRSRKVRTLEPWG